MLGFRVGASVIMHDGEDESRCELDGTFVAMRPKPNGRRVLHRQASSTPETSVADVPYIGSYYEPENRKPVVRDVEIQYLGCPRMTDFVSSGSGL